MLKRHFARSGVKAINRDETNTARGVDLQFRVINQRWRGRICAGGTVANISTVGSDITDCGPAMDEAAAHNAGDDVELQDFQ